MPMLLLAVTWATNAHAACAEAYSIDALVGDMEAVETFLRNADDENAGVAAHKLVEGLPCMGELLPRPLVGRTLRAVGGGLVASGDREVGAGWLRTAAEIEQVFDYGLEDLPEVHPVREVYADVKGASGGEAVAVPDAGLVTATVYLDGRKLIEPAARLERWHVLQIDDGAKVRSWVIEGNTFPVDALVSTAPVASGKKPKPTKPEPVAAAPVPKPTKVVEPSPEPALEPKPKPKPVALSNGPVTIERDRPWEKTPLMIGGGAVVAASGALWFLADRTLSEFKDVNDDDALDDLYSRTNRMVLAASVVAGVGVGTLTWGVILDGSTGVPAVRFRF